jgi:hypothetical protein
MFIRSRFFTFKLALLALSLFTAPRALAATYTDSSGTITQGTFDVSNGTHAPNYCQIISTTTATSLASLLATAGCSPIPTWATLAVLTPETSTTVALRWRADGIAPTAAIGDPIFGYTKDPSLLGYNAIANTSLISATGANVTVDVRIGG